jgi:hypothetical protein
MPSAERQSDIYLSLLIAILALAAVLPVAMRAAGR